jgi:hypothetical protein
VSSQTNARLRSSNVTRRADADRFGHVRDVSTSMMGEVEDGIVELAVR